MSGRVSRGLLHRGRVLGPFVVMLALAWITHGGAAVAQPFALVDHLGRSWSNERVRFPVSAATAEAARRGQAITDSAGRAVPFEVIEDERGSAIELLADLPAFGRATYDLNSKVSPAASDLVVETVGGEIRILNGRGGIAIRTRLDGREAPIAGISLADGSRVGASSFPKGGAAVIGYEAKVERRGPVAAVVVCRTTFASGVVWTLRVTMQAGDPAVLVDEAWSEWSHPEVELSFGAPLGPDRIYYRIGKPDETGRDLGKVALDRVADLPVKEPVFEVEPWLHWWRAYRRGTWFAAFSDQQDQALIVAAYRADLWLSEADGSIDRKIAPLAALTRDGGIALQLPATGQRRLWLIALLPKSEMIDHSLVGKLAVEAPPQALVVRHGDFPLDRVKDLPLSWVRRAGAHARLILTDEDVERLRSVPRTPDSAGRLNGVKLNSGSVDLFVDQFLRSGDLRIGEQLSRGAVAEMQSAVNMFLHHDHLISMGFAPHGQRRILLAVHLADVAIESGQLSQGEIDRIMAQAAFLGHVVNRGDYWSPPRGFAGNPNMTSMVAGYQGMIACLIDDHPEAERWFERARRELFDNQLLTWSDVNGGWLEAPHYAVSSYDYLVGVFTCGRKFGLGEHYLNHPRMKKVAEWLAKISTPPDPRIGNRRVLPPVGHTYMLETTNLFGTMAYLWRRSDPELSARLQWMHLRAGGDMPGVGGFWAALGPYHKVLKDITLPARAPSYGSELFPKTGAILRSHFGTERETQLHIIAGSNHAHYDDDSGSITIWGKGRLIANDFGYQGYAPASDHSRVDSPHAAPIMLVEAFSTGPNLDYLRGRSGGWLRQIIHVKDADPLGPNYYVIRDRLVGAKGGQWRLWLTGARVRLEPGIARVSGLEDVDTDVALLADRPLHAGLETITRRSASSGLNNNPMSTTQRGITLRMQGPDAAFTTVVYPRHKDEPEPLISQTANGSVVTVRSQHGTDEIFISDAVFTHQSNGVAFRGTAGAVLRRGGQEILALGVEGQVSGGGRTLVREADGAKR